MLHTHSPPFAYTAWNIATMVPQIQYLVAQDPISPFHTVIPRLLPARQGFTTLTALIHLTQPLLRLTPLLSSLNDKVLRFTLYIVCAQAL